MVYPVVRNVPIVVIIIGDKAKVHLIRPGNVVDNIVLERIPTAFTVESLFSTLNNVTGDHSIIAFSQLHGIIKIVPPLGRVAVKGVVMENEVVTAIDVWVV